MSKLKRQKQKLIYKQYLNSLKINSLLPLKSITEFCDNTYIDSLPEYKSLQKLSSPHPIKIKFLYFWKHFNPHKNYFTRLLDYYSIRYKIINKEDSTTTLNLIIYSFFGLKHPEQINDLYPNIPTVFYTGENRVRYPQATLNLTFDNSSLNRNVRFPYWLWRYPQDKLHMLYSLKLTPKNLPTPTKFCCFVYSNPRATERIRFCQTLSSRYHSVACGGRCLNNIGGLVTDKIAFQRQYRFCIAYENNSRDGYTTEKILDAYLSNCIPIYWGSKTIADDFNPETFINSHNFKTDAELIDYIRMVDTNPKLYQSYLNKPVFSTRWLERFKYPDIFFGKIAARLFLMGNDKMNYIK